tara:strand:+ start:2240 stop:2623 length:384 start_codon:yes stop_codon:yes gene_type:complete
MLKPTDFILKWLACAIIFLLSSLHLLSEVPTIESPALVRLEFGTPFEYEIKASGDPIGYSVSGLPFWLKREGAFLRGTPVSKKEQILQLQALNSDGMSEPHQLILRVVDIGALRQEAKSVENSRHKQ